MTEQSVQTDPRVHITPYGEDEIFVRRGSRSTFSRVIRDEGRRRMLTRLVFDIVEPVAVDQVLLGYPGREQDVQSILELLEQEGLVRRTGVNGVSIGSTEAEDTDADLTGPVRILGDGLIATVLADLLRAEGQKVELLLDAPEHSDSTPDADLLDRCFDEDLDGSRLIVVAVDHLRPALSHAINEWAAANGQPWMHLTTDGDELLIGPIVVPGSTACFNCLEIQDEAGRGLRNDFLAYKDRLRRERHRPSIPAAVGHLAAAWAALAIDELTQGGRSFLIERLLRLDTDRWDVITQQVFQIPRCPVCIRTRPDPRHTFL